MNICHAKHGYALYSPCHRIDHILEVVDFHDQVSLTGFKPSQAMPQMLCEEFYGCTDAMKEDKSKVKKPSKKKKAKHPTREF